MRRSRLPLIIAARRSRLARAQAELIGLALARLNSGLRVEYQWVETEGDRRSEEPLADAGGKGLFVRAVEHVLLQGQADLAVHSLKDLPARVGNSRRRGDGLTLAAFPRRGDVRDCLVAASRIGSVDDLPQGATIGTASPRRAAQLLRHRPDFLIKLMRGNIDTRVRKVLEDGQYDATLLAAAGLARAGLDQQARMPLDPQFMLPAAGQGALALQCRGDDHVTLTRCLPLNHVATAQAVQAERQVLAMLGADCHSAVGVLARPSKAGGQPGEEGWAFELHARVLSLDGKRMAEAQGTAPAGKLGQLVRRVVAELTAAGAQDMLQSASAA